MDFYNVKESVFLELGLQQGLDALKQAKDKALDVRDKLSTATSAATGNTQGLTAEELYQYKILSRFENGLIKELENLTKIGHKVQYPIYDRRKQQRSIIIQINPNTNFKANQVKSLIEQVLDTIKGLAKGGVPGIDQAQIQGALGRVKTLLQQMKKQGYNVSVSTQGNNVVIDYDPGANKDVAFSGLKKMDVNLRGKQSDIDITRDVKNPADRAGWNYNQLVDALTKGEIKIEDLAENELNTIIRSSKKYKVNQKMTVQDKQTLVRQLLSRKINPKSSGKIQAMSSEEIVKNVAKGSIDTREIDDRTMLRVIQDKTGQPAKSNSDRKAIQRQFMKVIAKATGKYDVASRKDLSAEELLQAIIDKKVIPGQLTHSELQKIYTTKANGLRDQLGKEMAVFAIDNGYLDIRNASKKELESYINGKGARLIDYEWNTLRNQAKELYKQTTNTDPDLGSGNNEDDKLLLGVSDAIQSVDKTIPEDKARKMAAFGMARWIADGRPGNTEDEKIGQIMSRSYKK